LGWTFVGWVVAFVWALTVDPQKKVEQQLASIDGRIRLEQADAAARREFARQEQRQIDQNLTIVPQEQPQQTEPYLQQVAPTPYKPTPLSIRSKALASAIIGVLALVVWANWSKPIDKPSGATPSPTPLATPKPNLATIVADYQTFLDRQFPH